MIRASGLSLRRGVKQLLEGTDFVIHPRERVGIVGRNGAGKTSLFALLQGSLDADAGTLDMPAGWRVASVAQELSAEDRPAREYVIDGDRHLRALQAERATATDGDDIARLEAALDEAGVWDAASRAEQLLAGLGFAPDQWMRPFTEFSGGWRMRLALARALMMPSDLLLLDEPTNHLDLDAMLWLERWLASYPGTVLVISHDTAFLDAVVDTVLHFDHGQLVRYRGGYHDFLTQRAERLRQARFAWDRQTRETARLQGFIDRFRAKATKARQAQSRIKALARMQTLAPLHAESDVVIRLPEPDGMPDPLLTLRGVSVGYAGDPATGTEARAVVNDISLSVRAGDRIGVLGVNGAGKSTLVKTLAGVLPSLAGEFRPSRQLTVGYFAQHQLDMLDLDASPLQHLARIAPQAREQVLRDYLGGFGFGGDMTLAPVAPFSGGEKARLALALIVWQKPNLLLLDEPSNHLDVETREALATALAEFPGSVLLVSHDRHLLSTTVDQFWIVADGGVQEFDGDLDDYRQWAAQRAAANRADAVATDGDAPREAVDRKAQRREAAETRQRLAIQRKPLERDVATVEADMARLTERLGELDARIADPDFYTDAYRDERPAVLSEHGLLTQQLAQAESRWLELQEALEAIN